MLVGFVAALVALIALGNRGASASSGGKMSSSPYSVLSWAPVLSPLCLSVNPPMPLEFALRWTEVESGGNPCAFGSPGAKGPDGNPREMSLAQLYNPDDFQKLGVDANKLRAYCKPGTQVCTRPLTADEMEYAARANLALMVSCRATALAALLGVGARWAARDLYMMTKLVHALPGLVHSLGVITSHLGHPPAGWEEFASTVTSGEVKFDKGTEHYRGQFPRLLHNAQETGSVVPADVT